jgi:hypothetical protein
MDHKEISPSVTHLPVGSHGNPGDAHNHEKMIDQKANPEKNSQQ